MKRDRSLVRIIASGFGVLVISGLTGYWFAARMDGPWGMIPGGPFTSGGPDLSCEKLLEVDATELTEIEVEIRPQRPRTITTWNVVVDGSLYLPADFLTPFKRWPHQVLADSRIRLRVGGRTYRCEAVRVEASDRVAALRRAAAAKYAIEPDGWASRTDVWWFEAVPIPDTRRHHSPISPGSIR